MVIGHKTILLPTKCGYFAHGLQEFPPENLRDIRRNHEGIRYLGMDISDDSFGRESEKLNR
jgi:hypothetical protein